MRKITYILVFLLAASSVFAQNTGGGGSGGGGGSVTVTNTPLPVAGSIASGAAMSGNPNVIGAVDSAGNVQSIIINSAKVLPLGNPVALADGQAANVLKMTGIGTASYLPLNIVPSLYNGTTLDTQFYCNTSAVGTVTASGATQILPIVASKSYRICAFRASTTPAVALQLSQGTGTNCATGSAGLSLALLGVTNVVFEPGSSAAYKGISANAVCITLGAAQTVNYDISYTVF